MRHLTVTDAFISILSQSTGIQVAKPIDSQMNLGDIGTIKKLEKLAVRDKEDEIPYDRFPDPWVDSDLSWSNEAATLRREYRKSLHLRQPIKYQLSRMFEHFKTMRLQDMGIEKLDSVFGQFSSLKELSLTGNSLDNVNEGMPRQLEILDLNANCLNELPNLTHLSNLLHLGLGFNQISSVAYNGYLPSQLVSLDLSYNRLYDLKKTILALKNLENLRNLVLLGNPLRLSKAYQKAILLRMPKLYSLDDEVIEKNGNDLGMITEEAMSKLNLQISFKDMTGLTISPDRTEALAPEQPADLYKYSIYVAFTDSEVAQEGFQTPFVSWTPPVVDFNAIGDIKCSITQGCEKIWIYGVKLKLIQEVHVFQPQTVEAAPAAVPAKKGADKGSPKKGKPEVTWVPVLSNSRTLGESQVPLRHFLEFDKELITDTAFKSLADEPVPVATLRLHFQTK